MMEEYCNSKIARMEGQNGREERVRCIVEMSSESNSSVFKESFVNELKEEDVMAG